MNCNYNTLSFEKIRNNLLHENKKIRKDCLDELYKTIITGSLKPDNSNRSDYLKLIIKCFNDKAEVCREKAVYIVTECINSWNIISEDDVAVLLIPAIHKKYTVNELNETSEEIRLSLAKLLKILIQEHHVTVSQYLEEMTDITINCILDVFPEVKKVGCECAAELGKKFPNLFSDYSEKIIKALLNTLKHKHYKIRVAAISCLNDVVQNGHKGAIQVVCGSLGECLLDQNPHVRVAVLRTVGSWFTSHPDRYSYFHVMLSLILTMLFDKTIEYRNEAYELWDKIGLQYMKENEENLKDKINFLPKLLEHYPKNVNRPNLGCRTIVANEMAKIIPTLIKELVDWKVEVRIKSSELLKAIILHAESNIIQFTENLLPAMYKGCIDEEVIVAKNVSQTAEIMGYFVPPDIYWYLIFSQIKGSYNLGHYIILASLLKYSSKAEISQKIEEITPILMDDNICEIRETLSQDYLLKILAKLIECCEGMQLNEATIYDFYLILLSVMSFGNEDMRNKAISLIENLSNVTEFKSTSDLNTKYLPKLFNQFNETCIVWGSHSRDFNVFIVLLQNYTNHVFEFVPDLLIQIFEVILNIKFDREVVFKTLLTIANLIENESLEILNHTNVIDKFITGPLKQQLIWKGGRLAEVIRGAAIAIVLLYLRHIEEISADFTTEVIPLVLSLCEDCYEETRIYSLKAVALISERIRRKPEIEFDIFTKCLTVVSDRLNDKSDAVRLVAVSAAKNLLLNAPTLDIYKHQSEFKNVMQSLEMIIINADDDNANIQNAVLDLLTETNIVENIRSVLPDERLLAFVNNCTDKKISGLLKEYLKL